MVRSALSVLFVCLITFFILSGAGCAPSKQVESYDNLKSDADLILTESSHQHGWKKSDCFFCHIKSNIHQENKINSSLFDIAGAVVESSGIQGCNGCHGRNGLAQ
ncbi:MAG: hypothetical protein AABZ06_04390 [Bdellovibrionota bacterium]